jgi:hypothetical protein
MLVTRGRENLVKARDARDADCLDVRTEITDAHERGVRASEHVHRHMAGCDACRAYARDVRRLSKQLQGLAPPFALGPIAALAKLIGGGSGKAVAGAGAAVAIAATGGVLVLATNLFQPGDPAPFQLKGVKALVGRSVATGQRVPTGTALVTARVRVPAGAPKPGERRGVTLACPDGMKVAGLQAPEQRFPLSFGFSKDTIIGFSTRARIEFTHAVLPRDADATVGVLCREPDTRGSIVGTPRPPAAGERAGRICVESAYVYESPGRLFSGTVYRGQPVNVGRRSASGRWVRITSDIGANGWLSAAALCR